MSGSILETIRKAAANLALPLPHRCYEPASYLYRQGYPTEGLLFIDAGLAKSSILAANGAEVLVALLGPGEVLGDVEYFSSSNAVCSVLVLETVQAFYLGLESIGQLKRIFPDFDFLLGRSLALRLAQNATRFEQSFAYSLEYNTLVAVLSRLGAPSRPVRKLELLEYLGVSSRHLNRVLVPLIKSGILCVRAGSIIVLDEAKARNRIAQSENR